MFLVIDCGDPDGGNTSIPTGSSRSLSSTQYLGTAAYSCNNGYEYESGSLLRQCQADKTWSGTPVKCKGRIWWYSC